MEDLIGNDFIAAAMKQRTLGNVVREKDLSHSSKDAYRFIRKYQEDFADFPPEVVVLSEVGISLPAIFPEFAFTEERIRKRSLKRDLAEQINLATDRLEEGDPDAARNILANISNIAARSKHSAVSFRKDYELRVEAYNESKIVKGLDGYLTPWESLNKAIVGYIRGEFTALLAYYSGGKSWSSCIVAEHLLSQGAKVLLVTMEMPCKKFLRRLDAVRYKIPFANLRRADMGEEIEQGWVQSMKEDSTGSGDIVIADKKLVKNTQDIVDLIKGHQADVAIVDGAYRLESSGKNRWESAASLIEEIQKQAELTNVPWIATSQMGGANDKTGKGKKSDPKAWDVRYGKEWLIEPDNVLIQMQTDAERDLGVMNIHIHKVREADQMGMDAKFVINWDMIKMDFTEIDGGPKEPEEALVSF